jgi:D-inositol-3-phosphate glycosyltransferase
MAIVDRHQMAATALFSQFPAACGKVWCWTCLFRYGGRGGPAFPSRDTGLDPVAPAASGGIRRIAMLAIDASPLALSGAEEAGGVNTYIRGLAHGFARLGVATDVFTRMTDPAQRRVEPLEPGVRVIHLPVGPAALIPRAELGPLLDKITRVLVKATRRYGPYQVLNSHCWVSGWVGLRLRQCLKLPLVHHSHSLGLERSAVVTPSEPPWHPDRVAREADIVSAADVLVATCQNERRVLAEQYGAALQKVRVVATGVDHERFCPGDQEMARDRLGGSTRRRLLVYVGRLHLIKGVDLAVQTVAELVRDRPDLDVELLVVGGAPRTHAAEVRALRGLVHWQSTADRVRFLPAQPHTALPTIYQAADLVLMPSRTEPFALVALEAQACGVPLVAARVGGLPELISEGITGVLVTERDPRAYAAVIAALLDSPARLALMRQAAAQHARGFDWSATATKLLAACAEVVHPSWR